MCKSGLSRVYKGCLTKLLHRQKAKRRKLVELIQTLFRRHHIGSAATAACHTAAANRTGSLHPASNNGVGERFHAVTREILYVGIMCVFDIIHARTHTHTHTHTHTCLHAVPRAKTYREWNFGTDDVKDSALESKERDRVKPAAV